MEIKGKITIFPEARKIKLENGEEKTLIICKGTISNKTEDGKYLNKSVLVKLASTKFPEEKVNLLKPEECYELNVESGFLSVESFKGKDGKERRDLSIVVLEGKLTGHKPVQKRPVEEQVIDEDLPF